ncbi:hypothetical protein Tco_0058003 [Tanacetum coccineum]
MEDEFYNLVVKGNDLKTYVRRFQELAVLCPNMVPNTEKLMEVFIEELPKSIEGNVIASKPQTLEETITITQRLTEQVIEQHMAWSGTDLKTAKLKLLQKNSSSMKNNADAAGDLDNVESISVIKERVDSSVSQVEEISELVQEDLIDKDKQGHEEMNGADYMDGGINDRQQNDTMKFEW